MPPHICVLGRFPSLAMIAKQVIVAILLLHVMNGPQSTITVQGLDPGQAYRLQGHLVHCGMYMFFIARAKMSEHQASDARNAKNICMRIFAFSEALILPMFRPLYALTRFALPYLPFVLTVPIFLIYHVLLLFLIGAGCLVAVFIMANYLVNLLAVDFCIRLQQRGFRVLVRVLLLVFAFWADQPFPFILVSTILVNGILFFGPQWGAMLLCNVFTPTGAITIYSLISRTPLSPLQVVASAYVVGSWFCQRFHFSSKSACSAASFFVTIPHLRSASLPLAISFAILSSSWCALPRDTHEEVIPSSDEMLVDEIPVSRLTLTTKFKKCEEARFPAGDSCFPVPSDGLCMYHCVAAAALGPKAWTSLPTEDKILHARLIKARVVSLCRESGDDATADRLSGGNDPKNYPGITELKYFVLRFK